MIVLHLLEFVFLYCPTLVHKNILVHDIIWGDIILDNMNPRCQRLRNVDHILIVILTFEPVLDRRPMWPYRLGCRWSISGRMCICRIQARTPLDCAFVHTHNDRETEREKETEKEMDVNDRVCMYVCVCLWRSSSSSSITIIIISSRQAGRCYCTHRNHKWTDKQTDTVLAKISSDHHLIYVCMWKPWQVIMWIWLLINVKGINY